MTRLSNGTRVANVARSDELNAVDLAFIVDTTGSMGPLIGAAKRQMVDMIEAAVRAADVRLRLGVVEYRDHPPQDRMVYRVHPMTGDRGESRAVIDRLTPEGGGDGPEAVLDGVLAACRELHWRPHARRLAVLVGDAPPHGVGGRGDGFPRGCPCGETVESVTAAAEEARVTLYALGLTEWVAAPFTKLARYTGGEYFAAGQGAAAIDRLGQVLSAEFGHLDLDGRVLGLLSEHGADGRLTTDDLAERLAVTPGAAAASITRLTARRLLGAA